MAKVKRPLTPTENTLANTLAGKYSIAKCFVSFFLFLTTPQRVAIKTFLLQWKAAQWVKFQSWVAQYQRYDKLTILARTQFDTVNAKIQQVSNLFNQIPVYELAQDCEEASTFVSTLIEGISVLRSRAFPQLQADLQSYEDLIVKYTAMSTYVETTMSAINDELSLLNKYIEMIDDINAV